MMLLVRTYFAISMGLPPCGAPMGAPDLYTVLWVRSFQPSVELIRNCLPWIFTSTLPLIKTLASISFSTSSYPFSLVCDYSASMIIVAGYYSVLLLLDSPHRLHWSPLGHFKPSPQNLNWFISLVMECLYHLWSILLRQDCLLLISNLFWARELF